MTTATTFAPILLNGAPYDADERSGLRDEDQNPLDGCMCRRCFIHDDPGGCLVIEALLAEAGEAC